MKRIPETIRLPESLWEQIDLARARRQKGPMDWPEEESWSSVVERLLRDSLERYLFGPQKKARTKGENDG